VGAGLNPVLQIGCLYISGRLLTGDLFGLYFFYEKIFR